MPPSLPSIITVPHPLLRKTLSPVSAFDRSLAALADTMIAVMQQAEGVGLAANQIGVDLQIFVYEIAEPFNLDGRTVPTVPAQAIVNPQITILDAAVATMDEGCLSIPGLHGPVSRPIKILLEAQDIRGRTLRKTVSGYEARVIQHETDHLHGKLFLDYITDPSKLRMVDNTDAD